MDQYAVMGNPITHSKSPQIHTLFAEQTNQTLEYTAIQVVAENFSEAINDFATKNGKGLNITVPLKQLAWQAMDECNEAAQRAEAVNTIVFNKDGSKSGFNTDGIGLVRNLQNHNIALKNQRILILGAGGAVRGILQPFLAHEPATITIANRTVDKALQLANQFSDLGHLEGCGYTDLNGHAFDIIINGTAAGLKNELPPIPDNILTPNGITYDMMYGDKPTAFVNWGQNHNASLSLDGLGMLVEQAAEAFRIWRGIMPNTEAVIDNLRA